MLGFLQRMFLDEGSGHPSPVFDVSERSEKRRNAEARIKFDLIGMGDHELAILRSAYPWGDGDPVNLLATPSSDTGRLLRLNDLGCAVGAGPTPYGYHYDGELVATERGKELIAFLRYEEYPLKPVPKPVFEVPVIMPSKLEEIEFVPGETAFWLDPELWDRTPTLANGKLDFCWLHLPDYEALAREAERERRNAKRREQRAAAKAAKAKAEFDEKVRIAKEVALAREEEARRRAAIELKAKQEANLRKAEAELMLERARLAEEAKRNLVFERAAKLKAKGCIYSWGPCGKCTGCTGEEVGTRGIIKRDDDDDCDYDYGDSF